MVIRFAFNKNNQKVVEKHRLDVALTVMSRFL